MDTLDGMRTVIAVVEAGSFTAAADRLGISKALVSKYIGEMESRLSVRLFNRSTRKISLTDAGRRYYEKATPLLEEFAELQDDLLGEQTEPQGTIRISTPVAFGESFLSPQLPEFLARFPKIKLDLLVTNNRVNMLEEGIDLVIRIGRVDDSNLIARQIADMPLLLCASPAYLAQQGTPKKPEDLAAHTCIIDSNYKIGNHWPLLDPQGNSEKVEVVSRVRVNSPRAVSEIAKADGGIGLSPRYIVEQSLKDGSLVQLLPDYQSLCFGLYAIYPHRRYLSRKVRCFIEYLEEKFGER
ncbi:LysR substrate-binding domain-containing protein [Corallincola platygyrae]|uniref:LysR substrate-binding domain-containing protein n=1 Tax=Corallincola platygyrae TaxID=1193278 RepID=A0ABW4XIU0_9GAMM